MKKHIFYLAAIIVGLTACENYFDEKYLDNGDPVPSDTKTRSYTLTAADYKTVANNATNKAIAAEWDSLHPGAHHAEALENVGKRGCFSKTIAPNKYLPAFIYALYPQLDKGTMLNITYLTNDGVPDYVYQLGRTTRYTLSAANYATIWGNDTTLYLTPSTVSKITKVLPQIDDDCCVYVTYQYSEQEPSAEAATLTTKNELYIFRDGYTWEIYTNAQHEVVVLPDEANGQVLKWINNNYPYATDQQMVTIVSFDDNDACTAMEYIFTEGAWTASTGINEETMLFELSDTWKADISTYFRQAIAGDADQGQLRTQSIDLEEGITYVWAFDTKYGMKGTTYKGKAHYGEGWFVTPKIKLKSANKPSLSFDHAVNYGPLDETRAQEISVWVSTDYTNDVTTATWTLLPWNEWNGETGIPDANSWTFYNSGEMDLTPWADQRITIGFRYKAEPGWSCATWEVKNILVRDLEPAE